MHLIQNVCKVFAAMVATASPASLALRPGPRSLHAFSTAASPATLAQRLSLKEHPDLKVH